MFISPDFTKLQPDEVITDPKGNIIVGAAGDCHSAYLANAIMRNHIYFQQTTRPLGNGFQTSRLDPFPAYSS